MRAILFFAALVICFSALSQTEDICSSQPVPAGWVIVSYTRTSDCDNGYSMRIRYIADRPICTEVEICGPQTIPPDWVIIAESNESCGRPGYLRRTIRRIVGQKRDQRINFEEIPDKTICSDRFELDAHASSGLDVTFSAVSTPANIVTISGRMVTIHGAGEVTIYANQGGNNCFNPAPTESQSFTIHPARLYGDHDRDGWGDPNNSVLVYRMLPGYICRAGDCNDFDATIHVPVYFYRDADGDGYGNENIRVRACAAPPGYVRKANDCKDSDNTIYPGAPEVCDEKDNDCDGAVDEGVKTRFYRDRDGDGYGNNENSVRTCTAPVGYVALGDDCNDQDNAIYPSAPEVCDGKDNDCDGSTDEGVRITFYRDADGDGYGNNNNTIRACTMPPGYAAEGDDCETDDNTVYPGAPEICDGQDNDCDGISDEDCPRIFINDTLVYEPLDNVAVLTVRLSRITTLPVDILYKTVEGTAHAPEDYLGKRGVVTIPAGSLTATISIMIVRTPNNNENDEHFTVRLSSPSNAVLEDANGRVTIRDKVGARLQQAPGNTSANEIIIEEKPQQKFEVEAVPNPSENYFTLHVKSPVNERLTIKVVDASGKVVETRSGAMMNRIAIGHAYRPGLYYVQVSQGNEQVMLKLVKQSK